MLERREREYLLGKAKVTMRSDVENLDIGDFRIDRLAAGEMAELPRWVADELEGLGMVDGAEEPFEIEIYKALSKEKMMGPTQLSSLPPDFYIKMKRRLDRLSAWAAEGRSRREDVEKLRASSYDLIGMRLSKLLSLSSSSTPVSVLADRLTPEEKSYFEMSQTMSKEWKQALLGRPK